MLPKHLDEKVARLHLDALGVQPDRAHARAGRLHRRAGRGPVQAGSLPLLSPQLLGLRGSSGRTGRCPSSARSASGSPASGPWRGCRGCVPAHHVGDGVPGAGACGPAVRHVALCASNPYATQHDVAAALSDEVEVFAGEPDDWADSVARVAGRAPRITLDDGADLLGALHAVPSCSKACSAAPRRPPPASCGCARWRPRAPARARHRRQRGAGREGAQRSLRHRAVRGGRHPARDEHPLGRPDRGGAGLRLDGARRRAGRARPGRDGDRVRGRSVARLGGAHGGLRRHAVAFGRGAR